jgi:hypothetical protein
MSVEQNVWDFVQDFPFEVSAGPWAPGTTARESAPWPVGCIRVNRPRGRCAAARGEAEASSVAWRRRYERIKTSARPCVSTRNQRRLHTSRRSSAFHGSSSAVPARNSSHSGVSDF